MTILANQRAAILFLEKMPVTLASRAEIVKKMDQQFNDDLKMRQDTTTVGKDLLQNNVLLVQNWPVSH